eukprot:TCONS_00020129-protein
MELIKMLQKILIMALTKPISLFAYNGVHKTTFYTNVKLDEAMEQPHVFSEVECIFKCQHVYLDAKDAFYTVHHECFCINGILLENQIGSKYSGEMLTKIDKTEKKTEINLILNPNTDPYSINGALNLFAVLNDKEAYETYGEIKISIGEESQNQNLILWQRSTDDPAHGTNSSILTAYVSKKFNASMDLMTPEAEQMVKFSGAVYEKQYG